MDNRKKIKAVVMLSGGLDSSLAVKIVADQGIEIIAVNYNTGFCLSDHRRKMAGLGANISLLAIQNQALQTGAKWRIPVELIDISEEYMEILKRPKYGYGSAVNPCIDCRIMMLRKTKEFMEKIEAQFIITGEVLGQRPMSQMRNTMRLIEKQSGCQSIILRPLSAKLLEPTKPEIMGWVDREKLYGFRGRGRKPQIALAEELGLENYPQPAGGCCFLTDRNYARRLNDLFRHDPEKTLSTRQVLLLKVGRHFRINERVKLVVGRNEGENIFLAEQGNELIMLDCENVQGPTALIEGTPNDEDIELAAGITARYSDGKELEMVTVSVRYPEQVKIIRIVKPMDITTCDKLRI